MRKNQHDSGTGAAQAGHFWEKHYLEHERVGSGRANPVLVDVAEPLTPTTALDLGCGEGGDAIWLAKLGWQVTAVDVSATALARAAVHASNAGVRHRIDFQQHDLADSFPAGRFGLVSAQYLHSPVEFPRNRILQTSANAVAHGGLLLIVAHASVPPWSWADPDTQFPTPREELAALELVPDEWRINVLGAPERIANGPNGQSAKVIDNVIAIVRLAPEAG